MMCVVATTNLVPRKKLIKTGFAKDNEKFGIVVLFVFFSKNGSEIKN
jgi:hypothetical protein